MSKLKAACVQMCSGRDVQANIADASRWIEVAASQGAELIVTPEMTSLIERDPAALAINVRSPEADPSLPAFQNLAARLGVWLVIGSVPLRLENGRCANRQLVFSPEGQLVTTYDKIHMFDVQLGGGEAYQESASYAPGDRAVLVRAPFGGLGLSICYDLRFAALYRTLAKAGADILLIPAAFTQVTGEAHWHVLLRARAIETGCFVIAAAQSGHHEDGRKTYGHSLIISPWGDILAEGGTGPGIILAEIDLELVKEARARIPALTHDRDFRLDIIESP